MRKHTYYLKNLFFLLFLFGICSRCVYAQLSTVTDTIPITSLPKKLTSRTLKTPSSDTLVNWVVENVRLFDGADSIKLKANLLLQYANQTQNDTLSALMHESLSNWYYYNVKDVNVDSTLFHSQQALHYYKRTNNLLKIAKTHDLIAGDLMNQNQLKKAQVHIFEAIAIYEKSDDQIGLADAYSTLSDILHDLEFYEDALRYGNKSIALFEKLEDPYDLAIVLFKLVPTQIKLNRLDIALQQANRSIDLIEENYVDRAIYTLARAYGSRGKVYEQMQLKEAALTDHLKAYKMVKATMVDDKPIGWEDAIGNIYFDQEKYQKALPFLEAGLTHDLENKMTGKTWELKEKISTCYEKTNQLDKALVYQKRLGKRKMHY